MMNETPILKTIMLKLGMLPNVRIFRNNVGMGWAGSSTKKGNLVIISNARPLHAGLCEGSSDLIGWKTVEITPDMVGRKVAIFTALEVKKPHGGRTSKEQMNFLSVVHEAGGIAGRVTSEDEALKVLR